MFQSISSHIQTEQEQGQPDLRFQDGQLEGGVAGQIAAERECDGGHEPADAAPCQAPRQQVREDRGQRVMDQRLQLQGAVRKPANRRQEHGQKAQRIKDGRLDIGEEGMARKAIRVPQWQLPAMPARGFVASEGIELLGKVPRLERPAVSSDRRQISPKEDHAQAHQQQTIQKVTRLPLHRYLRDLTQHLTLHETDIPGFVRSRQASSGDRPSLYHIELR